LGKEQKAVQLLKDAKKMAMQFDEEPYWGLESFRFIEIKEDWYVHDSFGETAMMAIEKSLSEYASDKTKKLWEKI
jgi:hypothetical protein